MTEIPEQTDTEQGVTVLTQRKIAWGRIGLIGLALLGLALFAALYYRQTNEGLIDRTAMDMAQVARNVSQGRGFTTHFVRPFNIALDKRESATVPELNNAPLYPFFVSVLFKVKSVSDQTTIWVSLGFLILTIGAAFALGRLLFDWQVGLLAAAMFGLSSAALRIGCSGREIILAAFALTLLLITIALHHRAASADRRMPTFGYAALAGVIVTALYLTDYVFAFALIPIAVYFWVTGRFGKVNMVVFLVLAAVLMAPYAYRNTTHTGFPVLGVRAWDFIADTGKFPADTLCRSSNSDYHNPARVLLFPFEEFGSFSAKLFTKTADIVGALPSVLGIFALSFAVVSALYRFKTPEASAVRGLLYGLVPYTIVVFGLYGAGGDMAVVFAPVFAVFASGYLMLMLNARKLHPFFVRAIVGGVLVITAFANLGPMIWGVKPDRDLQARQTAAMMYYGKLGARGVDSLIYTDVPWIASWHTLGHAVWLPMKDSDINTLEAHGLMMRIVVLTRESESYSSDEIWWMLHRVRLWREYVKDPKDGVKAILEAANIKSEDAPNATAFLRRLNRNFAVSHTISGFVPKLQDPLAPDEIQIMIHPDLADAN